MTGNSRASAQASAASRRKLMAGLTVGLLSVSAAAVISVKAGSGSEAAQVETVSATSRAGGAFRHGQHSQHVEHAGTQGKAPQDEGPTPEAEGTAPPLDVLANNCDKSKLQLHDGFQAGNKCVTTGFGEVGATAKNPTLIISSAPKEVKAGEPFQIKVSTRNLVRDRFLAAADGGYYKESSLLNEQELQRGHFHTACRMLESDSLAPDPNTESDFFKATEDKKGGDKPDVVDVDIPDGLPNKGLAECAAWAGDGSHRIPMMESVKAIPAFDTIRIVVR